MTVDATKLDNIIKRYPGQPASLITVLQDIHKEFNFLPCEALEHVGHALGVPLSRVFSVATFYKAFSLTPRGDNVVRLCIGTACHVRGASVLYDRLQELLKIGDRQTTKDGKFTLELVACVGMCAMAPVIVTNEHVQGKVKPGDLEDVLEGEAVK